MLNLVAFGSFVFAMTSIIVMLFWYLPQTRDFGRMVCRVCLVPARRAEAFICPGCGNDVRRWGIVYIEQTNRVQILNRVLVWTLTILFCALLLSLLCAAFGVGDSGGIEMRSQWLFRDQSSVSDVELLSMDERAPTHHEFYGQAYRPDGDVCELRLSGPPWKGTITDANGNEIPLNEPFTADLTSRWMEISARPLDPSPVTGAMVFQQWERTVPFFRGPGAGTSFRTVSTGRELPDAIIGIFIAACWVWLLMVRRDLRRCTVGSRVDRSEPAAI